MKPPYPTITVITPTFGRSTILDCIGNVVPQLRPGDEYFIVGDGPCDMTRTICREFPRVTYMETPVHVGDMGCTPWDYGIERCETDWIMFLGDDNQLASRALEIVRKGVEEKPDRPHIFAMMHTGRMLADSRTVGTVDNQQFVVPNLRSGPADEVSALPRMAECTREQWLTSDWVFIDKTVKQFGGVVYHPDVIAILIKQNFGASL